MTNEQLQEISKYLFLETFKQRDLLNSIDKLFQEVYDQEGENVRNNIGLNSIYQNLKPMIHNQEPIGITGFSFLVEKNSEITKELERVQNILTQAQKNLK